MANELPAPRKRTNIRGTRAARATDGGYTGLFIALSAAVVVPGINIYATARNSARRD